MKQETYSVGETIHEQIQDRCAQKHAHTCWDQQQLVRVDPCGTKHDPPGA